MLRIAYTLWIPVFCLLALVTLGCSGMSNHPAAPTSDQAATGAEGQADNGRVLWGIWSVELDPEEMTLIPVPLRNMHTHFNITNMIIPPACDDCVGIAVNSFNPVTRIIDADVTLRNPYPISGKDVRGILYTNSAGHELRNADAWTKLWDIPGGGSINPFRGFAKSEPNRSFAGMVEHTENYLIYIPLPPQYAAITFAVDASWPGNCKEPYAIDNFTQLDNLYDEGTYSATMEVEVRDWQDDVNKVTLVAPEITGQSFSAFSNVSGDLWRIEVTNNAGATVGDYEVRLIADSTNSTDALYDYVTITISEFLGPISPVDVTPPWLNIGPQRVCVDGNYAYTAGGAKGLHIFDISDPANPDWVGWVDTPGHQSGAVDMVVSGGYAFVAGEGGLYIVNILNPASPYIAKTVPFSGTGKCVAVASGYAYVSAGVDLLFIDITSISGASVVDTLVLGSDCYDIVVQDGLAYIVNNNNGLQIIDVDPPSLAYVTKTVPLPGYGYGIELVGGYAYVADGYNDGLTIVDVEPVADASVIKNVATTSAWGVAVEGDYAYMADREDGLRIININPPDLAGVVATVDLGGCAFGVDVQGGYAYVADGPGGFKVVDIDPPGLAHVTGEVESLGINIGDVVVEGSYAYIIDLMGEMQIVDISLAADAHLVKRVTLPYIMHGITVDGGYAFVAGMTDGLHIVDIDPPASAYLVKNVPTTGSARGVDVDGGYAYVAMHSKGLAIIDIDPIGSASVIKDIPTPDYADAVVVDGGLAYVTNSNGGFLIIDISPPSSAYIAKTVDTAYAASDVVYENGYAYVADWKSLHIIDVDPPVSAVVVEVVPTPDWTKGVAMSEGYAYMACYSDGLYIIDVDPIGPAYVYSTFETQGQARDVCVVDNYAYVADRGGGLRILKLW